MGNRLFTLCAAGSAVIWLLATAIWVRGLFVSDGWYSYRYDPTAHALDAKELETRDGWIVVGRSNMSLPMAPPSSLNSSWTHDRQSPRKSLASPGGGKSLFFWTQSKPLSAAELSRPYKALGRSEIGVRLILVISLASLLPAFRIWHLIALRRIRESDCCAVCGYDLRASPEQCPECGTIRKTGVKHSN